VRSVVVAGVAWQQPMLLGPTVVGVVGLRDTLLSCFHHLLVFASSVLEPDLNLQQNTLFHKLTDHSYGIH
jgi:hypothetical protein